MKVSIRYEYDAPIKEDLDRHIRWQADLLGYKEWASGVDLETHKRDISFDGEFIDGAFDSEAGIDIKDQIDVEAEASASIG